MGGACQLYTEDSCRLTGLDSTADCLLTLSGAPRGGRRECLGALFTASNTATSHDLRPSGRSIDVGRHLRSESHISAPHTKSLEDHRRAHLNTTWKAGRVNMPLESGVIVAKV